MSQNHKSLLESLEKDSRLVFFKNYWKQYHLSPLEKDFLPLLQAVWAQDIQTAQSTLKGFEKNLSEDFSQAAMTIALTHACRLQNKSMVELLLPYSNPQLALCQLVSDKQEDAVQILIPFTDPTQNHQALSWAVSHQDLKMMNFLLFFCHLPLSPDSMALFYATHQHYEDGMKLLIPISDIEKTKEYLAVEQEFEGISFLEKIQIQLEREALNQVIPCSTALPKIKKPL